MRFRFVVAIATAVFASGASMVAQRGGGADPAVAGTQTVPRTPWGAPDLTGIWKTQTLTPLERPAQFAGREFLTDAEIAEIETRASRSRLGTGRDVRAKAGTDADVEGAYNQIFSGGGGDGKYARTKRSSLIVDPPDGKLPALTPEALKRREMGRRSAARSPEAAEAALAAFGPNAKSAPYLVEIICSPLNILRRRRSVAPWTTLKSCPALSAVLV